MRHRITIQAPVESLEATGQPVVTWTNYALNEPAAVKPGAGAESMKGRQLEASGMMSFTIRYRSDLTTLMRIVHDSLNYGILSIDAVDGGRRYVEIKAKTVDQ
jgi:SPP1 family predicted phage head-tail adaptor